TTLPYRHVDDVHGRCSPAHRLFESGQHVARARHVAVKRDCRATRRRRIALADRAPTTVRRILARALRRCAWPRARHVVQRSPAGPAPKLARVHEFLTCDEVTPGLCDPF